MSYVNPFHENFFLRVALIPSDGYFERKIGEIQEIAFQKFPAFQQLSDTLAVLETIDEQGQWKGVQADFSSYGVGEVTVVDPTFINSTREKFKFWISGILYLMLIVYLIRRMSDIPNI